MTNLISVERLKKRLANGRDNTVIVDVRFKLDDEDAGRKMYLEGHLPGAVYLDLNRDLSGKVGKHGGSHPLPDMSTFIEKLGNIGIDEETTVVVYDQGNEMYAARFWWLLEALGHRKVYILEGGYKRWVEEGNEVSTELPDLQEKEFKGNFDEAKIVDMKTVREKLHSDTVIIDSRTEERYLGDYEPFYSKAGHIPGAKNYPWQAVLSKDGKWLKGKALQNHFSDLDKNDEIIVSCGSGVSACVNILALKAAGYENVRLYPGSFSDWISYDENEIEIGEE